MIKRSDGSPRCFGGLGGILYQHLRAMVQSNTAIDEQLRPFPDHTQLPESDGTFVFAKRAFGKNFQEHPQSILLTDSIEPVLQELHPDNRYAIGQDCGIYWRERYS